MLFIDLCSQKIAHDARRLVLALDSAPDDFIERRAHAVKF
jgi:hypothetical protein